MPRSLFLLLLLLLPSLALAQLPPLFDWSVVASTCVPDNDSLRRGVWRVNSNYLTLPVTATAPAVPGRHLPLLVRCPITAQGQWAWRELEVVYKDPDGRGGDTKVVVTLKEQTIPAPPSTYPPYYVTLARFDSNGHGPDTDRIVTVQRLFAGVVADFAAHTYWVEISLGRETLAVEPPRVYEVRLRYVPAPPYPEVGAP